MKLAPVFALYCLLVLSGYALAKYRGWNLFGVTGREAAAAAAAGGPRSGGAATGYHK